MLWIMLAFTWAFAGLIYYGARRIARHEPAPAVSESWLKEHVYRDGKTAWD